MKKLARVQTISYIARRNAKWYATLEKYGGFFINLNVHFVYAPVIPQWATYPREMKTYIY